ncbi:MAG: hypothetical protein J5844_01590 [Clostridia bacterium]|nr:hypothetical protein [Clostridia bacterium]
MASVTVKKVENYDVYENEHIKLSALFKFFQQAAEKDLDSFGITYNLMRQNNFIFVLTNITVDFFDNIKFNDEIEIRTYPRCVKGVFYIRDFDVYVNSKRCAYASSYWTLINFETRHILRPSVLDSLGEITPSDIDTFPITASRYKDFPNAKRTDVRKAYYSSLDHNLHMNNTFYPDIFADYFYGEIKDLCGKSLTLTYLSEIKNGEIFEILTGSDDDRFYLSAKTDDENKVCFTALLENIK